MNQNSMKLFAPIQLCLLLLFSTTGPAYAADGPLQVRNQFPIFLPAMPPYLEPAEMRDSLTLGLSHSSVYVTERIYPWTVSMDLELTELDIRLKKVLGDRMEIGLDVPVIRPSGGFFDRPLEQWHDLLKAGDYGRSERPMDAFLYDIRFRDQPVIIGVNDRTGLGDVRMTIKYALRKGSPALSFMAGLEAPTGDARTGYGNGSYDSSAAVLLDADLFEQYHLTANAGVTLPGDLKGYQTIGFRTFWYGGAGIEAAWWRRFSIIVQCLVQSSPMYDTAIREIDWPGVLLTIGGRYYAGVGSFEFSLTEDPDTAGAPDFTANVGYTRRF